MRRHNREPKRLSDGNGSAAYGSTWPSRGSRSSFCRRPTTHRDTALRKPKGRPAGRSANTVELDSI